MQMEGESGGEATLSIIKISNLDLRYRPHEVVIRGGGLNGVTTTGSKSTPARPRAAPSSRHNNRQSCTRTRNVFKKHNVPTWRNRGGSKPDNVFFAAVAE